MHTPSSPETARSLQRFVQMHPWWFIFLLLLIIPISWLSNNLHYSFASVISSKAIVMEIVFMVLAFVFISLLHWWHRVGFTQGIKGKDIPLCIFPTLMALLIVLLALTPFMTGSLKISTGQLIFIGILSCMIGIAEESLLRGLVLQTLLPKGVLYAVFLSSLVFGLLHLGNIVAGASWTYVIGQALNAFGIGLIYAVLRVRTGSIWLGIILHAINDFGGLCVISVKGITQPSLLTALIAGGFLCTIYITYTTIALRPSKLREIRAHHHLETHTSQISITMMETSINEPNVF